MTISAGSVAKIVVLNGGGLVGKTRFHKTAYFLEEFGVGFGFSFEYYHFGPYSKDLSVSLIDANALDFISEDFERTQQGAIYSVFKSSIDGGEDESDELRSKILAKLGDYDSVILELAATADFLAKSGYENNSWEETKNRKPEKSTDERIQRSKELLEELNNLH
ncbi:MAG: hypothetical protein COC17_06110 [Hyphomicrobiales bacterium]|nr:hypothetical protein [Hyphomicrobiales bacterium]PCH50142.1 MAG: hypothetical protein COC17_06110 [Hyphomicrobiales bacterium]